MSDKNRNRGILTSQDRTKLEDISEGQDSLKRDARYRIRQRLINGIIDMHILVDSLPDEDIEIVFEEIFNEHVLSMIRMISLIYRGHEVSEEPLAGYEDLDKQFEDVLQMGLEIGMQQQDELADISVLLDIERHDDPSPDFLRHRIIEGDGTLREYNYLLQSEEAVPLLKKIFNEKLAVRLEQAGNRPDYELTPMKAERLLSQMGAFDEKQNQSP